MKELLLASALSLIAGTAMAASFTFGLTVSPPSTGVVLTGIAPCSGTVTVTNSGVTGGLICSVTAPIPAGTEIATSVPSPSDWVGAAAITAGTGAYNSNSVVFSGSAPNYTLNVGATALPLGSGTISGTEVP